jgi:hypothetical protein
MKHSGCFSFVSVLLLTLVLLSGCIPSYPSYANPYTVLSEVDKTDHTPLFHFLGNLYQQGVSDNVTSVVQETTSSSTGTSGLIPGM